MPILIFNILMLEKVAEQSLIRQRKWSSYLEHFTLALTGLEEPSERPNLINPLVKLEHQYVSPDLIHQNILVAKKYPALLRFYGISTIVGYTYQIYI